MEQMFKCLKKKVIYFINWSRETFLIISSTYKKYKTMGRQWLAAGLESSLFVYQGAVPRKVTQTNLENMLIKDLLANTLMLFLWYNPYL